MTPGKFNLTREQQEELLGKLEIRFAKNRRRHPDLEWTIVRAQLEAKPDRLSALFQMEQTGGEPDVVVLDKAADVILFADCSAESPIGRRSLCYDRAALESRKENRPADGAVDMAADMGIELLSEEQYRALQKVGAFDLKTSSWVKTPPAIRELGGAVFCDRRYNTIFVYHNGAESYYSARGFRGLLRV
ncbi:MAG: DUF4256 domain-containing protein [Clostridiaceae bacterium]|nr:DUF4256 domain-containing protein [Clostridiaceae bacterium]